MRKIWRYSKVFKRGVVEKVERGEYASLSEGSRRNGIRRSKTLTNWIRKYGWEDILPKRVKVETMSEIDEVKALRKEVLELKAALADAHVDWCLESSFLDIACERLGDDGGGVKKRPL